MEQFIVPPPYTETIHSKSCRFHCTGSQWSMQSNSYFWPSPGILFGKTVWNVLSGNQFSKKWNYLYPGHQKQHSSIKILWIVGKTTRMVASSRILRRERRSVGSGGLPWLSRSVVDFSEAFEKLSLTISISLSPTLQPQHAASPPRPFHLPLWIVRLP